MKSAFEFSDYRTYLREIMASQPKQGYGQSRKLAEYLEVHTTLVSQIMNGQKELSIDHAVLVTEYFGLSDLESRYFISLIQLERAGNESARQFMRKQLSDVKAQASEIKNRVKVEVELSEQDRARFYSHWIYSAVRQLSGIPEFQSVEAIASHLNVSIRTIKPIVDFLLSTGLCKEASGRLTMGPSSTHVESTSPWVRIHHGNWRARALQSMDQTKPSDLHYTAPMSLSRADAEKIRERLIKMIEEINDIVDPSPSEAGYCIGFDWFEF